MLNFFIIVIIIAAIFAFWKFKRQKNDQLFADNDNRSANIAIALAFALSASDGNMTDEEMETIENWAHQNIPDSANSRLFHKAITSTKAFFFAGNKIDSHGMCEELAKTATLAQRYNILQLCMKVVSAKGVAKAKELVFLRNIAQWLELDEIKVSMMMESYLPVNIHEVKDAEFILGINHDTPIEKTREKLNREYRKWNGRITNSDQAIRAQAKTMIQLIASLKNKYQTTAK